MKYYVGVDIGGTNTKIGILDNNFNILNYVNMETLSKNGAKITFERIWNKILELSEKLKIKIEDIQGIGLGIPGPVKDNAIVTIAANFSWGDNFNAKKLMEDITSKQVKVENDVRCIALGEHKFGAAKGYENVIVIPIGTGVASGIILNNEVVSGTIGCAGEFGHIVVEKQGDKCGCGLNGCLEKYVSATGLVNEYIKRCSDCKLENITSYEIFKRYEKKDEIALEIVDNFCDKLAYGTSILLNVLNPEIVVYAGGVSKSADIIIPKVKEYLKKYTISIALENVEIKKCDLFDLAGIKGAASLVRRVPIL